jgi:hypothetical protein
MKRIALLMALLSCLAGAICRDARAQGASRPRPAPTMSSDDVAASKDPFTFTASGTITDFHYTSDKGDPVGQGSTLALKQDEMSVSVTPDSRYKGVPIDHVKLVVSCKGGKLFELWFSTEKMNKPLSPGSYDGAGRVEFTKYMQPGISISGNGRGCLDARGGFSILQADFHYDSGKVVVDSFAVEFEQHCGDRTAGMRGHLYYNYVPAANRSR